MTYRCASCHRRLLLPAFVGVGGYVLGPTCAKRAGKLQARRKGVVIGAAKATIQDGQIELFA